MKKSYRLCICAAGSGQAVRVHPRPSAVHNGKVVPHMQIPENICQVLNTFLRLFSNILIYKYLLTI